MTTPTCKTCQDTRVIEQETVQGEAFGIDCPDCATPTDAGVEFYETRVRKAMNDLSIPLHKAEEMFAWCRPVTSKSAAPPETCPTCQGAYLVPNPGGVFQKLCQTCGGAGSIPTGPTSAAEVSVNTVDAAFKVWVEKQPWSDKLKRSVRASGGLAIYRGGAEFGYSQPIAHEVTCGQWMTECTCPRATQRPNTAALLAIAGELRARAPSETMGRADALRGWAERIYAIAKTATASRS